MLLFADPKADHPYYGSVTYYLGPNCVACQCFKFHILASVLCLLLIAQPDITSEPAPQIQRRGELQDLSAPATWATFKGLSLRVKPLKCCKARQPAPPEVSDRPKLPHLDILEYDRVPCFSRGKLSHPAHGVSKRVGRSASSLVIDNFSA